MFLSEEEYLALLNTSKKYTDAQINKVGNSNKVIFVNTAPPIGDFKEGDLVFVKPSGDIYQYKNNNWEFQINIKGSGGTVTTQDILDAIAETEIDAKTLNGKQDIAFATSIQGTKADNAVPKTTTINSKALTGNITITKSDVSLGNVDNTSDANKPISTATQTALDAKASNTNLTSHTGNTSNPHSVTKTQVGLGNVDNTSDANKPVSTATQTVLNGKLDTTLKGSNSGLAELDSNGKVPSTQLPSYVDDVLEYASLSNFPSTGESGKIYLAIDTSKIYRWGGSEYVVVSEGVVLGETSSTAYRGDRGKIAYDHSQLTSGNPHSVTKANVGLGNVDNTSDANKPISAATTTALNAKVDKTTKINNKPLNSDVTLLVSDITNAVDLTTAQILQNKTIKNSTLDGDIYAQNAKFIIEREKAGVPEPGDWHESKPFLYTTENTGLGSDIILKYLKDPIDNQDAVNKRYLENKFENLPISFELEENGDLYFVYGDE